MTFASPPVTDEYELLDSGGGRKLERFGEATVDRPSPQALWRPSLTPREWQRAAAFYERSSEGGGAWRQPCHLPESWVIALAGRQFRIKPTGFGHMGIFPEQQENWEWIGQRVRAIAASIGRAPEVLNLFAYTGGATLAAASAGATVCHVDAARGIVTWARENAELSGLPKDGVRWIVEDVPRFVERELRRGHRYHGIILDPPSFGRGKQAQVWLLERDLPLLLEQLAKLLADEHSFIVLSAHTPGVSPQTLANLLAMALGTERAAAGNVEAREMLIRGGGPPLPSGELARFSMDGAR